MKPRYKVYFEGVWDEIISTRGFTLFKKVGIDLCGDLFSKEHYYCLDKSPYPDLIIATNPNMESVKFGFSKNIPVIFYTIFPDQIVGWNFKTNKYKLKVLKNFKEKIKLSKKVLVNSNFSKDLIKSAWPEFLKLNPTVCYLGVDTTSIGKVKPSLTNKSIKVLWNHMWRKDKGYIEALKIILELAEEYRNVCFIIGRKEDWDPRGDNGEKYYYTQFVKKIKEKSINNIQFKQVLKIVDYWKLLKSVDISFSTSFHETFGLSMLEQEAAGIACILPKTEVYPEIHQGALLVEYKDIKNMLKEMIKNHQKRFKISASCIKNSQAYKIDNFVVSLAQILFGELK